MAADSSGSQHDATYASGATLGTAGAVIGDTDAAVTSGGSGVATYASGAGLPVSLSSPSASTGTAVDA